jgi:hypothetical protein
MEFYAPVKHTNFQFGLAFNVGLYGYHTEPIAFATDSNVVNTDLNISNAFHNYSFYNKYTFNQFSEGRLIPFVDAKLGWSFFRTKLYIADPEDVSNCEPLEKDIMQKDNNWAVYAGAGFDLKLSGLIRPEREKDFMQTYFTFSFGYNLGGKVSYMNVDHNETANVQHHGSATSSKYEKVEYYAAFVNTQTQVVHEHHIGYLFTSPIRMLEIKAGFSLRF